MWCRFLFLSALASLAACGAGGGGAAASQQQELRLVVQALEEGVAGNSLPLLVSVKRGNAPVSDYTGLVTFRTEDPAAFHPESYRFTRQDNGQRVFTSGFVFPSGVHVLTVTAEDVDDPATIGISVRAGSGSQGNYVPPPVVTPPGHELMTRMEPPFAQTAVTDIIFADMDGDGDSDVLGPAAGSTRLWLNNGSGGLAPSSQSLPGATSAAAADVDDDGDVDLVLTLTAGLHLLRNAGAGTFDAGEAIAVGSRPVFGDMDGDGDQDLGAFEGQGFTVRANDGTGGFGNVIHVQGVGSGLHRPILGDVDGDGDLDLFANRDVYRNLGNGVFEGTGQSIARDIRGAELGDMDGDGDPDLVLGNFMEPNDLYVNDGKGGFKFQQSFEVAAWCTTDVMVLDIDEDGDLDIVEANLSVPDAIWINEGNLTFTGMWTIFPGDEIRMCAGDLTGDGLLDVVTSEYFSDRMVWYRND